MKKANARLQKALQRFKDKQSKQFEPRRSVANAVITSVDRDSVTGHTTGIVRATIDGVTDQNVFVGSGQGFSVGSVVRVENRGGSFAPDWTLLGRVGSVAGAEGTLDIDRTLSTPTGVILSTDAYTPVAGAGVFSSVTVTFNQNQDYESVAYYDIQWFKDSEGSSTAEIISVPHVTGEETNLAVVGGLLPSAVGSSQSYSFRVRARGYSGAVGGWTDYSSIETAADATAPSSPTGLGAVAIDDYTLRLYWTANSEPDFAYYVLDVSANGGTAGRLTGYPRTVGNQNEFILGVSPNLPRYFAVKAVDATGNESSYSSFAGPFQTENLPSDAGLFYFGPTIELVSNLTGAALTMDVNFNILEAGWFVHLVAPDGTNEIVQVNTSTPGGSSVSNGDGYRYNIVRAQGGTTAQTFSKGTIGHALTTAGFIQSDVREGVSNTPTIRMYEWDSPYTNAWADKSLKVALGNLGGVVDPVLGSLSGYGLYSDNVFLTGQIIAQGGAILGSIEIDGGDIIGGGGAVTINDDGITIVPGDSVVNKIVWNNGTFNTAEIVALVDTDQQEIHSRARQYDNSDTVISGIEATDSVGVYYASVQAFFDGGSHARLGAYSVISGLKSFVEASYESGVGYVAIDPGLGGEVLLPRGVHTDGNIWADSSGLNIGTVSQPFNALYVENLYADSIVGTPSGLEIGVDVQAWSQYLDDIVGLSRADGRFIVGNGTTWVSESGSTARASLGLTIGTHVQAYDADLTAIAALAATDGNFIVGNGTTWVAESGDTARVSLGIGTTNSPTFAGLTINGSISVTGNVDGVDVSAHKSRHESGGADTINHDSLTGFVANEHIDHSTVSVTAGTMLTGGGTIAATRTLNVNLDYDPTWTGLHTFTDHTEMDSVDINGALTVTDDLTVVYGGYYPLFVNVDTVNPNNSNVGIMTNSPDPQFALDVNGPARAQYFIGPHALQLDDAAMIVHFDGPPPYNTNFDGSAIGHLGQVPTVSGGVIFREGLYGKAIQVAEATTNLLLNPSFEYDSPGSLVPTQWAAYSNGTAAGTRDVVDTESLYGSQCLKLVKTGGASTDRWGIQDSFSATSGQSYTYSIWIKTSGTSGSAVGDIYMHGVAFATAVSTTIYDTGEWTRYTLTNTASATTSGAIYVWINTTYANAIYVDGAQVEQKAYATPYCDGSLGTDHSWSGMAHASTSRSTAAEIEYDGANLTADAGTIMMWYKPDSAQSYTAGSNPFLLYHYNGGNRIYLRHGGATSSDSWSATLGSGSAVSGGTFTAEEWTHIALTWNGSSMKLYVNGVEVDSGSYSGLTSIGDTFAMGSSTAGTSQANGLYDDFVILARAASADEIRAIYESNAPVFAESSITAWRTPSQVPIWVDSEGLWMRATGGGETLGAYGGAGGGVSKSWGGKDLYQSDFLLGNATDGYIHWHAYQDDADPWGAAGMEVQAQVDITGSSTISGTLSIDGVLAVSVSGTYKFWVGDSFLAAGPAAVNDNASFALIFQNATMIGTDVYSPTYDSGDVLIGNELAANVLWDQSAGQMLFRDNTTTKAYVDTDGSIKAGGGAVTLDDGGFALAVGTGTPNRIRWMASSTERASINGFDSGGVATISVLSGQNVATAYPGAISLTASEGGGSLGSAALSLDGPGNQAVVQFDDSDGRFKVQQTGPTVWLEVGPTNAQFAGALTLAELSSTPSTPADGTQMRAYMKADKFVIQYNEGGTVRYKYLPLTSTGVTWVHTTTAP